MKDLLGELGTLIARHAPPGFTQMAALPGVTLSFVSAPTTIDGYIAGPQIIFIVQGAKMIAVGNDALRCGAGQYVILSLDLPLVANVVEAAVEKPYLGVCLALNREVIASLLLETSGVTPTPEECQSPRANSATAELIDPIVRYLRLLDRPLDIPVLGPAIEREIVWRLIVGDQGDTIRQICVPGSRLSQISQAAKWIRDNHASKFRIEDLAALVRMGTASLHRHFRALTSLTPIQYQKHVRLNVARSRFLAGAQDVANVGYAVGYDSPSQFSREYRRWFGKSPTDDARPAREAAIKASR